MQRSWLRALTFLMAAPLSLVACQQGEGDICEVDSDCAGTLICCPPMPLPDGRGLCEPGPSCSSVPVPDAGPRDAGRDAGVLPPDGGPLDGGPLDGGPLDGGPPDADLGVDAGVDGGVGADAGMDAGEMTPDPGP